MTFARRVGLIALFLGLATPARAFVCTRATDSNNRLSGPSLSWRDRNLNYTVQADGTEKIPFNTVVATIQQAFAVWQTPTLNPNSVVTCGNPNNKSDITFAVTPTSTATWVGYDFLQPRENRNLIIFRDQEWQNSDPVETIALTTTTYSAFTGEIIDADIEFNSENYRFVTTTPAPTEMDLLNTAVHEIGHFLGLAHCVSDPNQTCGDDEVMEPSSTFGETKKRTLKCDDLKGLLFKYPPKRANGYCDPAVIDETCGFCAPPLKSDKLPSITETDHGTGRGGCQASGGALGAALATLLWGWRRRRCRGPWLGLLLLGLCGACRPVECNGDAPPLDPLAPLILRMELAGQVPNDPWRVILLTDFADFDGDLGPGTAEYYANYSTSKPRAPIELNQVFQASSGLPLNATSGRFALLVRFADSTTSGSVLHLGTRLVDNAGHASNCYTLDLSFNLNPAPAGTP